jgi:hypothetical protein
LLTPKGDIRRVLFLFGLDYALVNEELRLNGPTKSRIDMVIAELSLLCV